MDFFQIAAKPPKKDEVGVTIYPDFIVGRSEDLMVRAKNFYAIWDEPHKIWSTDEYRVQELVDAKLQEYKDANPDVATVKWMRSFGSNGQSTFRKYLSQIGDHYHQLDENLTFRSQETKRTDYVSKRLPYDLAPGDISGWEDLVSVLYDPENREKIEWTIGAIVSGDSKTIQKFLVLFGPPGAGKGTIITIIEKLFPGYIVTFKGKELGGGGQFASAQFSTNPLIAIEHDGDMSRVEDNTLFNSIVSHELMKINEKYKPSYDARINAMLIMGTNKAVKITDAQSGFIRRLIDAHPTNVKLAPKAYWNAMDRIDFQLGAIAHHCLQVYKKLGKNYYGTYQPKEMMFKTNAFANFIDANFEILEKEDGVSAKKGWDLYKAYNEEYGSLDKKMPFHAFKAELGNYFEEFHDKWTLPDGKIVRNYYKGFKQDLFKMPVDDDSHSFKLALEETVSLLNLELADFAAQYAKTDGTPSKYWDDSERFINGTMKRPRPSQIVDTTLKDLDPYLAHYVKTPENMLVVDFDLEDENGKKSLERNLEAAALWPATYGELSHSGFGVHLHYYYDGDVEQLDPNYAKGIEVKRFSGNAALRRRLSRCNAVPIAILTATMGILPFKEKKRVLDVKEIKSVAGLRRQIEKALNREIHSGTKSNVDYIKKAVDDFYESGRSYDISDLQGRVFTFAQNSTNQPIQALRTANAIRWKSDDLLEEPAKAPEPADDRIVFYDVEVYPNLFAICWKFAENPGDEPNKDHVIRMINPTSSEVEQLLRYKLVGYNNRDYDNHIIWGAYLGFDNERLYELSQRIINGKGAKFNEAYKISYTDILDFASKKQSLKKWQIELGLEHREMDIPWDEPVAEEDIMRVIDYCVNDVVSTEHVFNHLQGDWKARLFLSSLSGLSPNEKTARHVARIVFGREDQRNPQKHFRYTDLSVDFPGYKFEMGKSTYRGIAVNEGGFVWSKPGLYQNVVLLDIASMHPTSIGQLNLFGDEFTPKFMAIVEAQLQLKGLVKTWDFDSVRGLMDGKLDPYLDEIEKLKATDIDKAIKAALELRYALKIAINIVYGMTSAKFDNSFMDRRNVDNIVAKRGALFMVDLMFALEEQGYELIHIKTDSVKIANATPEATEFVQQFGEKYGYNFEVEATYEKVGLFNDAVYVAKKLGCEITPGSKYNSKTACWSATGTQFIPEKNPYVFKKLFGYKDDIHFEDVCIVNQVNKGKMYLDFGPETVVNGKVIATGYVEEAIDRQKMLKKGGETDEQRLADILNEAIKELTFVGKIGKFVPVKNTDIGGKLWRIQDGKAFAVSGTTGYLWMDAGIAESLEAEVDLSFFDKRVEDAKADIDKLLEGSPFESVEDFLA